MVKNVWAVTDNAASVAELVSAAKALGETVTLVYAGEKSAAAGAATAYWAGELKDETFVNYIPVVVDLIKNAKPELVLAATSTNGRLAASFIAAACGTTVLSDLTDLGLDGSGATVKRMVYGGMAFKTDTCKAETVVAVLSPGAFDVVELEATANIEELSVGSAGVTFTGKRVKEGKSVNLSLAKRVIAVGRGIPNCEYLEKIRELADILGCEVGCTRPLADEETWMPKETYIGISGVMMKPDFYLGIGISGQVQHTVGINSSKTIIAINKDKGAPIFTQCDFGIVGDLCEVVPALIEKLK